MSLPSILLVLAMSCVLTHAESRWVSQSGDDANPGTDILPFASIVHGLSQLQPGMTLHVLPGQKPWGGNIRITANGTAERPIVVDGHGSLVSGRGTSAPGDWQAEGRGIFSRKLPNNAWGMETHWEGGFPLVWFDGQPGRNAASRADLNPGGYFLHKNRQQPNTDPLHNTLHICLPAGRTPTDVVVETITGESGIYVGGHHVIVRNFITEYGGRDGFATHRNRGVVFENVEARHFMDQGMSHHGSEVTVRKSHFHHNAGGGVVDVYPACRTRYENCLIEADTWRGGVEFHSGEYEMVNCLIRANAKKALTVAKGAKLSLVNCVLVGRADSATDGVTVGTGSQLMMRRCTLIGFSTALAASFDARTYVTLEDCQFLNCPAPLRLSSQQALGLPAPDLRRQFTATDLASDGGQIEINSRVETSSGKWQTLTRRFGVDVPPPANAAVQLTVRKSSGDEELITRHGSGWPLDRLDNP